MAQWVVIGFFVLAIIWLGFLVVLALNGGLNTKNGFVGIEKTPHQMDAMIAKAKARQARYDRWRANLNERWGKKPGR